MPFSKSEALQRVTSSAGFTEGAARALRAVLDDVYNRIQTLESEGANLEELVSSFVYGDLAVDLSNPALGCYPVKYEKMISVGD